MAEQDTAQAQGAGLNKGLSLIAAYRMARLADGPARRAALQENRRQLREERKRRLQNESKTPTRAEAPHAGPSRDHPAQPAEPPHDPPASVFAALCEDAVADNPSIADGPCDESVEMQSAAQDDTEHDLNDNFCRVSDGQAPPATDAEPEPEPEPLSRVALADIGFGPGMILRLGQIGIETAEALAHADPSQLRLSLGDASALINVDAWIANAREATRRQA